MHLLDWSDLLMTQTPTLPAFQTLQAVLLQAQSPYSVSQLHGLLCGYVCANQTHEAHRFLHQFVSSPQMKLSDITQTELFELLSHSEALIQQTEFDFQLYLPEDQAPLTERAQAFSEWCQSFLQSLHLCHIQERSFQDPDAREIMESFQAFAELDYEILASTEEDEMTFFEIYEYARLAVLDLHLACKALNTDEAPSGNTQH